MNTPAPGWYTNGDGALQWWDGSRWGELAPAAAATPSTPAYAAPAVAVPLAPLKSAGVAYLFAILLGEFGAHRFYLGRIGSAVAQLILWMLGFVLVWFLVGIPILMAAVVWWIVDLFLIPGMVRQANGVVLVGAPQPYAAPVAPAQTPAVTAEPSAPPQAATDA